MCCASYSLIVATDQSHHWLLSVIYLLDSCIVTFDPESYDESAINARWGIKPEWFMCSTTMNNEVTVSMVTRNAIHTAVQATKQKETKLASQFVKR